MEDNKKETKNEGKKYDEKNLTYSIIFAAIIVGLTIIHTILGIPVHGNGPWFFINLIFALCAIAVAIVDGIFFFKVTMPNMKKDLPSFIVSLAALAVAASCGLWWTIDMFTNLFGFIGELAK